MSYTIMVIDDEQMILDMLRDQFEMEQYQVITAKSGEEALQKLTQQPDIILLDINMPGMDGVILHCYITPKACVCQYQKRKDPPSFRKADLADHSTLISIQIGISFFILDGRVISKRFSLCL